MVCLVYSFLASEYVFAEEAGDGYDASIEIDAFEINTVSDAENLMRLYFARHDMSIEIGSPQYAEYLMEILMYEDDEKLKELPQYEKIKIYASEYLSNINSPDAIVRGDNDNLLLNLNEQHKTIDAIEKEARQEELSVKMSNGDAIDTMAVKGYSSAKAVNYARKWANSRNASYNYYLSDCTNFVSQCVKAGGKTMSMPSVLPTGIKNTTNYWYSARYQVWHTNNYVYRWKESSSFINVADFFTYWKNKGVRTLNYANKAELQKNAVLGDVVQLKNGEGKWFHSIIITGGVKGDRKYCGHSLNRLDEPVKNISGAVSFRVLRF